MKRSTFLKSLFGIGGITTGSVVLANSEPKLIYGLEVPEIRSFINDEPVPFETETVIYRDHVSITRHRLIPDPSGHGYYYSDESLTIEPGSKWELIDTRSNKVLDNALVKGLAYMYTEKTVTYKFKRV
jgi:hypothetical protein